METGMSRKFLMHGWLALLFAAVSLPAMAQAVGSQAPPENSLTLRQAIDTALGKNPSAALARAQQNAAQAGVDAARTAWLPQLGLTEDISRGNDPVYAFGTRLRQQRFTQQDFALNALNKPTPIGNFATRLNGQWMLFDWLGREKRIRSAKGVAASAASMSDDANQQIVLRVVEAYQSVLYAQRRLGVARHEQTTAEALLHDAQVRVKAGLAVESDLLAAQVNLSERQQQTIAAEGDVDTAWAGLEAAMGVTATPRQHLAPIPPRAYPVTALTQDIDQALKTRPDLKALRQQNAAQREQVSAARRDFLPQIDAYGNWETDRDTFAGNGGNNWVAGVQLKLDILPLGKRARLLAEKAKQQQAQAQQQAGEQAIRLAVEQAWTAQRTAGLQVKTAQAAMAQAAESLRILRNRYHAGLATMTDLLRAEDAQRRSQNDYWRAVYGNTVTYTQLMYATGNLTPAAAEALQ
jgi:outer membrane protein TolC